MPTHMGQAVADHVVLIDGFYKGRDTCKTLSFTDRALFRVSPDGELEPKPFKVPKGRVLVVTDVEWSAFGGGEDIAPLAPASSTRTASRRCSSPR
jgi:hypothetical protein